MIERSRPPTNTARSVRATIWVGCWRLSPMRDGAQTPPDTRRQAVLVAAVLDVAAIVKTKLTVIAIEGLGHGPFGLLGTDPPGVAATRSLLVPINQWGHSPLPLSRMPPPCRLSQTRHLLDAIIIWLWCGVSQHLDNQEVEVGLGAVGVAGGEVLQDQAVGAGQEQAGE